VCEKQVCIHGPTHSSFAEVEGYDRQRIVFLLFVS
jgi:hypothetical protein